MKYFYSKKAITLISLIITIIILLILSTISINLIIGKNNLINKSQTAKEENTKQTAIETLNLKITNIQMQSYSETQDLPSLQYLADKLCEDNDIEYVTLEKQSVASLNKIIVGNNKSIFTKLKEYPYEFEINSSMQLASINGVPLTVNNSNSTTEVNYDEGTGFYYSIFSNNFCILWQNYTAPDTTSKALLTFPFEFEFEPSCQVTKLSNTATSNNIVCNITTKDILVDTNYGYQNKCSFSIVIIGKIK